MESQNLALKSFPGALAQLGGPDGGATRSTPNILPILQNVRNKRQYKLGMYYELIAESFPKARKPHKCVWCGEHIQHGETYRYEFSKWDGDLQVHKWHLECDQAFKFELDASEEHELEFDPFVNVRPVKSPDSDKRP